MTLPMLTSRALGHFLLAYESGNLRLAASRANVTQPAVSKSLAKLELHLGVPLFERTPHGVEPTVFAHLLREHAQNIQNEERFVEAEIAATTAGTGGELRIAVGAAWGFDIFPPLLAGLRRTFPGVDVELRVGVRDRLLHELIQGTVDVWLGAVHELAGASGLDVLETGRAEMGVFCVPDHPLAASASVAPADLALWGWAGLIDDAIGLQRLDRYFAGRDLAPPRVALRCNSVAALFAAAAGSDLLVYAADTLAPEAARRGLVPLPLELPMWSFPTGLACRPAANHLATVRHLRAALSR